MTTAQLAVQDGTSHRLSNEDLGLICRRIHEIERRINEGTLSKRETLDALQRIVEDDAESLGPCKKRHRSDPLPFKRRPFKERKKSLAGLRLRSKERINRLFWHFKLSLKTGRFGRATERKFHPEDIMAMMWEAENIPCRGLNYGRVPIQTILETEEKPIEREAMIVNQTLQWLGTNVGKDFLIRFIRTADIPI